MKSKVQYFLTLFVILVQGYAIGAGDEKTLPIISILIVIGLDLYYWEKKNET